MCAGLAPGRSFTKFWYVLALVFFAVFASSDDVALVQTRISASEDGNKGQRDTDDSDGPVVISGTKEQAEKTKQLFAKLAKDGLDVAEPRTGMRVREDTLDLEDEDDEDEQDEEQDKKQEQDGAILARTRRAEREDEEDDGEEGEEDGEEDADEEEGESSGASLLAESVEYSKRKEYDHTNADYYEHAGDNSGPSMLEKSGVKDGVLRIEDQEDVLPKRVFSDKTRFVFVAGLEGSGHHAVGAMARHCEQHGQGFCQGADVNLYDLMYVGPERRRVPGRNVPKTPPSVGDDPGTVFIEGAESKRSLLLGRAMFVQELRQLQQDSERGGRQSSSLIFLNSMHAWAKGYKESELSYPNMQGKNKEMQHPDVHDLAQLAEQAGVDFRVLVLSRRPQEYMLSTTGHRHFGSLPKESTVLADTAASLAVQISLLDPAFVMCAPYSELGHYNWWQESIDGGLTRAEWLHPSLDDTLLHAMLQAVHEDGTSLLERDSKEDKFWDAEDPHMAHLTSFAKAIDRAAKCNARPSPAVTLVEARSKMSAPQYARATGMKESAAERARVQIEEARGMQESAVAMPAAQIDESWGTGESAVEFARAQIYEARDTTQSVVEKARAQIDDATGVQTRMPTLHEYLMRCQPENQDVIKNRHFIGRFGNWILAIVHAFTMAIAAKRPIVQMPRLPQIFHQLGARSQVQRLQVREMPEIVSLAGGKCDMRSSDFYHTDRKSCSSTFHHWCRTTISERRLIYQRQILPHINMDDILLKCNAPSPDTVLLHVRDGDVAWVMPASDIQDASRMSHAEAGHVQPPCEYYHKVVREGNYGKAFKGVRLIHSRQQPMNPCVSELEQTYAREIAWDGEETIGTPSEGRDICSLLRAKNMALTASSFGTVMSMMSTRVENLFVINTLQITGQHGDQGERIAEDHALDYDQLCEAYDRVTYFQISSGLDDFRAAGNENAYFFEFSKSVHPLTGQTCGRKVVSTPNGPF